MNMSMKKVYCPPETLRTQVRLESPICTNYSKTEMKEETGDVKIEDQEVVDFTDQNFNWD